MAAQTWTESVYGGVARKCLMKVTIDIYFYSEIIYIIEHLFAQSAHTCEKWRRL